MSYIVGCRKVMLARKLRISLGQPSSREDAAGDFSWGYREAAFVET